MLKQNSKLFSHSFIQFIISFFIVTIGSVPGQTVAPEKIGQWMEKGYDPSAIIELPTRPLLEDYIHFALRNNPQIRSAFSRWQAAIERITISKSLPDPKISFGYFIESIQTAVGPQEYKIGISQMIPWFPKLRLQKDIQAIRAEIEFYKMLDIINDVRYSVFETYYDYYYLKQTINITQQNIDLVKNWEVVVRNKYKTALAGHLDLIKTQIESIRLQDDLLTLQSKQVPVIEKFQSLLNIVKLDSIYLPEAPEYKPFPYQKSQVEVLVWQSNPVFLQFDLRKKVSELAVKWAKLNYYPDLGIGMDYIFTGEKLGAVNSGTDPVVLMMSVSFPLWWKKQKAGVEAAKATNLSADEQIKDIRNKLMVELENIWFELEDAERKIILYQKNLLPKSLESLRASEKSYISDKTDFLTLIDSQRRYLQFQLEYEKGLVRYVKAISKLEKLTRREL